MANIHSHCKPIPYKQLNGKQKELFNFQKIAAAFANFGFNCIKLADDWQGADFLAYHLNGETTLRIQLKSRLTISTKYQGKKLWIAFPYDQQWYVVEHDTLIEKVRTHTQWLASPTWKDKGIYHSIAINPDLLDSLTEDKLGPVYGTILDIDETPS
jgi:hypothetical protein